MEVVEAQAVARQAVAIRGFDQAAETADLRESHVIEQKYDDIRRIRLRQFLGRPPLLRVFVALSDDAAEPSTVFVLISDDSEPGFSCA